MHHELINHVSSSSQLHISEMINNWLGLLTFQMRRTTLVARLMVKNSLQSNHGMSRDGRTLRVLAPRVLPLSRVDKERRVRIRFVSVILVILLLHLLTPTDAVKSDPQ